MGDEDGSVPGSSWFMGSNHRNQEKPKERSVSSLGDPKLHLRIREFSIGCQEIAKENWETIRILHVRVDHVVQSKIQSLRREFKNLAMKKDEKVSDFSSRFTKIISELRDLGEQLEEKEALSKLL